MNQFLASSKHLINRHGSDMVYVSTTTITDPVTRITTKQKTEYVHRMYPKQLLANQFNFPNLIGKESITFYLANDSLGHAISVGDEIKYKNRIYGIVTVQETVAFGEIVLWRLTAVKA